MAFAPNPAILKMVASGKGRHVYPTLITWDGPGGLSLSDADIRPGDEGRPDWPPLPPLPDTRPFVLTALQSANVSSAWLTIRESEYATWEQAFSVRRKLILTVKVGNVERDLLVQLTHVRIIPADFHLLWIDAKHAGANGLARVTYEVWSRLRRVIPHWIPPSKAVAGPLVKDEAPSPSQKRPLTTFIEAETGS